MAGIDQVREHEGSFQQEQPKNGPPPGIAPSFLQCLSSPFSESPSALIFTMEKQGRGSRPRVADRDSGAGAGESRLPGNPSLWGSVPLSLLSGILVSVFVCRFPNDVLHIKPHETWL